MNTIETLYQKFLDRQCSREEAEFLLKYFQRQSNSEKIIALIQEQLDREYELPSALADDRVIARNRQQLQERIGRTEKVARIQPKSWKLVAAAVVVFLLSISLYFMIYQKPESDPVLTSNYGSDVFPGGNRAYISLSNGQNIVLDSAQTGLVAKDGKHTYADGTELLTSSDVQFATIHTPVGGEYQLMLPDGTKVWLNAMSSLTYPVRFGDGKREVEIQGEVYLEVAKNASKPFIVKSKGQRIQVLGTAFNVRDYDAKTVTTLLQGKIELTHEKSGLREVLIPGQQAVLEGLNMKVEQVDPADFISWKDGFITDKDGDVQQVCSELERWYDVKFVFPEGFTNRERAIVSLDRHAMLSGLLLSLEKTYGVQFSINGKEVRVH